MTPARDHGPCARCSWFRRTKPASQLLAAVIDTSGPEVAQALGKIVEDEQKLRDEEAGLKSKQASAYEENWPARPMMSDYCGRHEADEVFLIAQVKNRALDCDDFEPGAAPRHACADCRHRVPARGADRDRAADQAYTQMITRGLGAQASISQPEGQLGAHRSGVAARKALELSGAYATRGRLTAEPQYLDHCAHFSSPDDYVVCALQNTHHTCSQWKSATDQPVEQPLPTPAPVAAKPVALPEQWTETEKELARSIGLTALERDLLAKIKSPEQRSAQLAQLLLKHAQMRAEVAKNRTAAPEAKPLASALKKVSSMNTAPVRRAAAAVRVGRGHVHQPDRLLGRGRPRCRSDQHDRRHARPLAILPGHALRGVADR